LMVFFPGVFEFFVSLNFFEVIFVV